MKVSLLDNSKKKKIMHLLNEQYGIEKLPYLFLETGKGKYRIYSGALSRQEMNELAKAVHIEIIGARICKVDNEKIRLNFDIMNIPEIKSQLNKNIIELSDMQAEKWLKGENIDIKTNLTSTYLVIKNKNNIIGIGQNANTFIKNYMPKERRVKK